MLPKTTANTSMDSIRAFSEPNFSRKGRKILSSSRVKQVQAPTTARGSHQTSASTLPSRAITVRMAPTSTEAPAVHSRANRYLPPTTPRRPAGVAAANFSHRAWSS